MRVKKFYNFKSLDPKTKASKLPSLDESLLTALDFLKQNKAPKLNLKLKGIPFVVGSGNAYNTGQIIFNEHAVIFANESNFLAKLKSNQTLIKKGLIQEAIIISASGEKDAIWELEAAKKMCLKTTLMTCNSDSQGAQIADEKIIYLKTTEPQTYNISTYLGMILSATQEKPEKIKEFIESLKIPKNLSKYQAYSIIVPDAFAQTSALFVIKQHELFGPRLSLRSFSFGDARHAKFLIPWEKELVISFGANKYFGLNKHRWEISLPQNHDAALVMALGYYLIGLIQKSKPAYYQKNVEQYCQEIPKAYGTKKAFPLVVE